MKRVTYAKLMLLLLVFSWLLLAPKKHAIAQSLEGLGIFTNGGGVASQWITQVNPSVVVVLDNFGFAATIPASTTVVGRSTSFSDSLPGDVNQAINNIRSTLPDLIAANPNIDVWQAYNEPLYHLIHEQGFSEAQAVDWLIAHDNALYEVVTSLGKSVCLGNFKEGWPTNPGSSEFRRYINAMSGKSGAYLCVHEHEDSQANWNFGSRYNGRFTQIRSAGLNLPVIVTVAGYDSQAGPTVGAGSGWSANGITVDQYTSMVLQYQRAARANGAIGVAIFQLGLGGEWQSFDVTPLLKGGTGETGFGPQCVGTGIGQYAASVIKNAPNLNHVKFLTPVFNLTDPTNAAVVGAFKASLTTEGVSLDNFHYLAGNAYNMSSGTISGFVNNFYTAVGSSKPIVLTETGWFTPDSSYQATQADYDKAKSELEMVGSSLHAALYFAPYPNISNAEFSKHNYLGSNFGSDLCPNGDCGKVGANPGLVNPTDPALYGRINDDGLGYVLGIAGGTSVEAHLGENGFITKAHDAGITPVLRFGTATGGGSGFEPSLQGGKIYADKLIAFVKELDSKVSKDVYVILGPNEPMTECWATPNCGGCGAFNNGDTEDEYACTPEDDDSIKKIITVRGQVTQATWTDTPNPANPLQKITRTGLGIRNSVVTNYSGDPCTVSKLGGKSQGGNLVNIDYKRSSPHVTTSSDGRYEIPVHMTSYIKERFIAFSCNGQIADLYKCDLTKDTDGVINLDVDLNCQGTYRTVNRAGGSVRPFVDLVPRSPGENVPIADMNKFTMCVESAPSRPPVRVPMEQVIKDYTGNDETGQVIQFQRASDKDLSYLPPNVSPDPNCEVPEPPYTACMPHDFNPLNDEFSSFTTITHGGKDQLNALSNEAFLACGPITQLTSLRYEQNSEQPAPASKGKHPYRLPSLAYIESMGSYKSTFNTDPLGVLKVNKNQQGIVQKFATTPATLKAQIQHMDPKMPFAYNGDGDLVLLGEVEVPGYGGKTLFEIQGVTGTGKKYPSKYFPSSCIREMPNSLRTTSPLKYYAGNEDDSAVTETGTGSCSDPYTCARDIPVEQMVALGGTETGNATGRRSYAEMTNKETPPTDLQKLSGCLARGGPDCANAGKGGLANILTYPKDERTDIYETGEGLSPKAKYERAGDNECKRIGFPVVNYCMCAQSEHANGFCPNPLNEVDVPNQGDDAAMLDKLKGEIVSGSVLQNNGLAAEEFHGRSHLDWGGIVKFIDEFLGKGFAAFAGKESGGGACITYAWSDWYGGFCPTNDGPFATGITVRCTPEGTTTEMDCECENRCRVSLTPSGGEPFRNCTNDEQRSCKQPTPLAGVQCDHRVKEGPAAEWGANEHPDCKGDIEGTVEMLQEVSIQENSVRNMFADAWLFPGEERNACAVGGTLETAQVAYEVVDKTTYNYTTDLDLGQTAACVHQEKVYKLADRPWKGTVITGDAVIGSGSSSTSTCNAFNIMGPDGLLEIDFAESLERALNTLNRDADGPTSVLVNRYGPWCLHEAYPSKVMPFAYNLIKFIDDYAVNGADRRCSGNANLPPRTPRPSDVGQACSAFTLHASPGDPYFDYYRGVLNNNRCPLKTNRWPSGVTVDEVIESVKNANMPQGLIPMNDASNPALYELRQQQLPMVVEAAKDRDINPYLIIGIWGTESGWSNRPSCYESASP